MTATPPADREHRGAILRPYPGSRGFVLIVRPGKALHHMSVSWQHAQALIDWSIDTGDDMTKLPAPYRRVPMPEDAQAPAPAPAPAPPPTPAPAPRSGAAPQRVKRKEHRRDATGRLAF